MTEPDSYFSPYTPTRPQNEAYSYRHSTPINHRPCCSRPYSDTRTLPSPVSPIMSTNSTPPHRRHISPETQFTEAIVPTSSTASLANSASSSPHPPAASHSSSPFDSKQHPLAPSLSAALSKEYRSGSPSASPPACLYPSSQSSPKPTGAASSTSVGAIASDTTRTDTSTFCLNTASSNDRVRTASASTPPPSPPLSAIDYTPPSAPLLEIKHSVLGEPSDKYDRRRTSSPCLRTTTAAAAAAAAASYTSQELAIAYSMVTSTQQEQVHQNQKLDSRSAKLSETRKPADAGSDALCSLLKKTAPLQEPYFRTRHTIASQHTLSTLGGDEEHKEFNEDMFVAMRNRIFELEAKTVHYTPFNRCRKRSIDRSVDDYTGIHSNGYHHSDGRMSSWGYEGQIGHYPKRAAYQPSSHTQYQHASVRPSRLQAMDGAFIYRQLQSHPSWYTPETYASGTHPYHQLQGRDSRAKEQEWDQSRAAKAHNAVTSFESDRYRGSPSSRSAATTHDPPSSHSGHRPPAIQPRPIRPQSPVSLSTSRHHEHTSPTNHQSPILRPSLVQEQPKHSAQQSQRMAIANAAAVQQQQQQCQSFHQRQHRAQQQAQSAYSRSYHLQKHMRMLDQQRAARLAQQQQQQQQQQQNFKIERHYQPHQQMHPHTSSSQPVPIQPHPMSSQQQQQQQQQQVSRSISLHQHHQQMVQQQLIQRYQQHRQLQQKQQQARQQQQLRQQPVTPVAQDAGVMNTSSESLLSALDKDMTDKLGGFNSVKTLVPPECANCMALDTLTTHPRVDAPRNALASSSLKSKGEDKFLCSACLQYLETRGKSRPVPPYRVNFLKKIHCRFKKRLHEVRFQGWQDAQVLELEDRMTSHDFHAVFYAGVEDGLVMSSQTNSRQISASSTAASSPIISSKDMPTPSVAELPIVIKIEDDDDEMPLVLAPPHAATETRTFANEASVGELFGHRWKSEPMVGYTLVHFGGSDRTRMVPMNPTVPSLTITFRPESESVLFAFRVLVNGLCLLSSGGGPPALHMPEMADDDESEEEPETEDAATSETAMKVAGAAEDQCVGVMPDSDSEQQCKVDNEGVDNVLTQ